MVNGDITTQAGYVQHNSPIEVHTPGKGKYTAPADIQQVDVINGEDGHSAIKLTIPEATANLLESQNNIKSLVKQPLKARTLASLNGKIENPNLVTLAQGHGLQINSKAARR